ncbi:MAG TPA: MoxR family ATPase [Pyrinomonadaceae bacterium]|nr:MoxR family ATPase [Pyrinomonadaceae bacterium]
MASTESFRYYEGDGTTVKTRGLTTPAHEKLIARDDPAGYVAERGLRDAVNVALVLGQPLLVTGEPGTGKTQLAGSIAHELGLERPLVFRTKTTSNAKDLFYRYDALRHFHDANVIKKEQSLRVEDYISFEALGLAIMSALPGSESPRRSVVLIDEVDKAPRDFPNDILNEIEEFSFTVSETGKTFKADEKYRPIVLLTSNSEKNLPDAFLRRCVFYNITAPSHEQLLEIVRKRLKLSDQFVPYVDPLVRHFEEIRSLALKKKPATAELLAWLAVLNKMQANNNSLEPGKSEALAFTYSILAKNKEDGELMFTLASKLKL